jgi:hypothetical protein
MRFVCWLLNQRTLALKSENLTVPSGMTSVICDAYVCEGEVDWKNYSLIAVDDDTSAQGLSQTPPFLFICVCRQRLLQNCSRCSTYHSVEVIVTSHVI